MIRVRFHGRGGHGVKTASRILGTAAFAAGYEVQDSPVYGAERRGAAVAAFTRISEYPILDRGAIANPDLIIIGDETLLADPAALVLQGQNEASTAFLNSDRPEKIAKDFQISNRVVGLDLTGMTMSALRSASALSVGLGAASARLAGCVELNHLLSAVERELEALDLTPQTLEKNLELAREVYRKLSPAELAPKGPRAGQTLHKVGYDGVFAGAPSILTTGNSVLRRTGSWRLVKPEIDYDLCTRCGLCVVYCPDGTVALDDEGYPVIDYEHCKGCMICRQLCPIHAVAQEKEVRAW